MKKVLLCLIFALPLAAQFSSTASHIRFGSSLPATCSPTTGDVFFKTAATIGQYQCLTTNNWTALPSTATSPGSPVDSLQRNNAGSFAAVSGLTQDPTSGGLFWTPVSDPNNAPTAALAGAGAGNLSDGTYQYDVAFVTAQGITLTSQISGPSSVVIADHTVNGKVSLTGIPVSADPRVTKRRIVRTLVDGSPCTGCGSLSSGFYILTYINDNTTTTYTDNTSDTTIQGGSYGTFATNVAAESWFTNINRTAGALMSGDANIGSSSCILMMIGGNDIFVPNSSDFTGLGCRARFYYGVEADVLSRDVNGAVAVITPGGFSNFSRVHGGAVSAATYFQESDNTGTNGNLAKFDVNGKVTDGPSSTTPFFTAVIGTGTAPSVGTCGTIGTGSKNLAGFITSATGACVSVLTLSTTATTGWSCSISNSTTPANVFQQTGSSTTTATFTGVSAANDILRYSCIAY